MLGASDVYESEDGRERRVNYKMKEYLKQELDIVTSQVNQMQGVHWTVHTDKTIEYVWK